MERLTGKRDGRTYIVGCPDFALPKIAGLIIQQVVDRLAAYEETGLEPEEIELLAKQRNLYVDACGELPLKRIREIAQADRDGRCVVLPCKIFDKVWDVIAHYQFEITEIDILPYGKILFRCGNKGTDDYVEFYDEDLGDTFIFEEPPKRDSLIDAEAALRREQDG